MSVSFTNAANGFVDVTGAVLVAGAPEPNSGWAFCAVRVLLDGTAVSASVYGDAVTTVQGANAGPASQAMLPVALRAPVQTGIHVLNLQITQTDSMGGAASSQNVDCVTGSTLARMFVTPPL
jgi:hypothetical protein